MVTPARRQMEFLARLDVAGLRAALLRDAAARLAEGVRTALAEADLAPDKQWARDIALRDSIEVTLGTDGAVVGSTSGGVAEQEMGTPRLPPRPVLSPVAARLARPIAEAVGAGFVALLQGKAHE